MVRRLVQLLAVAVLAVAIRDASGSQSVDATLDLTGCRNPDLLVDGEHWETRDAVDWDWPGERVVGTFRWEGESGTFIGPDGIRLSYDHLDEDDFSSMICVVPS